jgi:hypothetical protein
VRALHSESPDRAGTLDWFRQSKDKAVLVSVGMLTEGVDLPDAQTAFLARPTTSRILLRQMIGRVLRGKKSGGGEFAHVVYFQDDWGNFADVLEPPEVIDVAPPAWCQTPVDRPLPAIMVDDDQNQIPTPVWSSLLGSIARRGDQRDAQKVSTLMLWRKFPDNDSPKFPSTY